jgi:hypothetical protein
MAYLDDIDQRLVKRGKFGPLDVYPQEERQKEVSNQIFSHQNQITLDYMYVYMTRICLKKYLNLRMN